MKAIVSYHGGDVSKVDEVTIAFNAVSRLLTGRVGPAPAFLNAEGVALEQRGLDARDFRVEDYGALPCPELVLVTSRATLEVERERISAALDAIAAGIDATRSRPDEAVDVIAHAAATDDTALERAQLDAVLPGWSIRSITASRRGAVCAASPDRHARRREQTRARLVRAARKLFARQGVDNTRINEITDEADVGFGSFYNHFESKAAIVEVVLMEAVAAHGEAVDAVTTQLDDPPEVIAAAHRHFVRLARRDPEWAGLVVRTDVSHDVLLEALGPFAERDIRRGVEAGRLVGPRRARRAPRRRRRAARRHARGSRRRRARRRRHPPRRGRAPPPWPHRDRRRGGRAPAAAAARSRCMRTQDHPRRGCHHI